MFNACMDYLFLVVAWKLPVQVTITYLRAVDYMCLLKHTVVRPPCDYITELACLRLCMCFDCFVCLCDFAISIYRSRR